MKFKKILLPLASVASVAAVVTPIVTSCGGETFTVGNDAYKSKFADSDLPKDVFKDEAEATKKYLEYVKKDTTIFGDDYMLTTYSTATRDGLERKIKVSISLNQINPEEHALSFSIKVTGNTKYTYDDEDGKKCEDITKGTTSITAKGTKIALTYSEDKGFGLIFDTDWVKNLKEIDASAKSNTTATIKKDGKVVESTSGKNDYFGLEALEFLLSLSFNVHYFSKCSVSQE